MVLRFWPFIKLDCLAFDPIYIIMLLTIRFKILISFFEYWSRTHLARTFVNCRHVLRSLGTISLCKVWILECQPPTYVFLLECSVKEEMGRRWSVRYGKCRRVLSFTFPPKFEFFPPAPATFLFFSSTRRDFLCTWWRLNYRGMSHIRGRGFAPPASLHSSIASFIPPDSRHR